MSGRKALIICFTDFISEPRVLRTVNCLLAHYDVHIFSTGRNTMGGIKFTDISSFLIDRKSPSFHFAWPAILRKPVSLFINLFLEKRFSDKAYFNEKYWTKGKKVLLTKINELSPDLIIGHGIFTLPLIANNSSNAKTIFNAHEYYLKEFENDANWMKYSKPYYEFIMESSIRKIDLMFCVSENIQKEYLKQYQVRSVVITNATNYSELLPVMTGDTVKIIHHGAAIPSRELELMADMMNFLDNQYELYFMLVPTDVSYLKALKQKYKSNERINFIDPVPVTKIAEACNKFDIGLFILPPVNFNWLNALPNKLFEYIQARLCIAISPNPDMKALVEKYDLGVVASDYTAKAMAEKIASLSKEDITRYKANSQRYASELSGEHTQKLMLKEIGNLFQN